MRRCALSCKRGNGRPNSSSFVTTSYGSSTQLRTVLFVLVAEGQILGFDRVGREFDKTAGLPFWTAQRPAGRGPWMARVNLSGRAVLHVSVNFLCDICGTGKALIVPTRSVRQKLRCCSWRRPRLPEKEPIGNRIGANANSGRAGATDESVLNVPISTEINLSLIGWLLFPWLGKEMTAKSSLQAVTTSCQAA